MEYCQRCVTKRLLYMLAVSGVSQCIDIYSVMTLMKEKPLFEQVTVKRPHQIYVTKKNIDRMYILLLYQGQI